MLKRFLRSLNFRGTNGLFLVGLVSAALVAVIGLAALIFFQRERTVQAAVPAVRYRPIEEIASRPAAQAPGTFDSGSDGSDGALVLTTPGTIIFDPRTFSPPLDPDGDNVYHFTTITIGPGVTITLRGPELRMKPVYWLAQGAVQIDGVIDLSGGDGHPTNDPIPANRFVSVPGPGGYPGGVGLLSGSPAQPGSGPGGGGTGFLNQSEGHGGGGAGYGTVGSASQGPGENGGVAYGNDLLAPLIGGSGGGGGNTWGGYNFAGGGGAGGGAILIASSASVMVNGSIIANGGNGGSGAVHAYQGNGGGGSGGAIHLLAPIITGTGTLDTSGGAGGSPDLSAYGGHSGGGLGSRGRIRLEAFQHQFTGSANPTPILGSPAVVFLPTNRPSVRVVDVVGASVPEIPTGSFTTPDTTINAASAATVTIEAHYVPLGTAVQLHVISENAPDQIVDSTPLAGTPPLLTATAVVTIPSGFSQVFVRTTWTP